MYMAQPGGGRLGELVSMCDTSMDQVALNDLLVWIVNKGVEAPITGR